MGDHTLLDKTMMRVWVLLIAAVCIASTVALTTEEEVCLGEGANKPNCAKVQCAQHTHCDTCTKDLRCGWCASDKVCIPGVAAGPTKANCSSWDFAFCSSLPCASHESCGECAADPVCGWCSTSNVCTEGSMRGPVFMACIKRDWLHEAKMCPKKPANCPCPLPDGSCPTKQECDRNNHIGHKIKAMDHMALEDIRWYASVEDQIPVDVVPPPLLVATPEPTPLPTPTQNVQYPQSEILQQPASVDDGFLPGSQEEVVNGQNDNQ